MKKVFCFGDGYATGHIWPEWPQILQVLAPDYQVINIAAIGAGSEFLVSEFVEYLDQMQDSTIIFQWPHHKRFDKLIEDKSWDEIIANDSVYHFNVNLDSHGRKWWNSSGSTTDKVQTYHRHYVQTQQSTRRQQVYQALVSQTAANLNCKLVYTTTEAEDAYSRLNRFADLRGTQVQPAPPVHFYWLMENIIPQAEIEISTKIQSQLEALLLQTQWVPYDPDREEIWNNIKSAIKLSNP